MRRVALMVGAIVCAACAAEAPLVVPEGALAASPAVVRLAPSPGTSPPASLQLAGLTFSLPSAEDLRATAAYGFTGSLLMTFRPSIHGGTSRARQLENGNHELYSYLPSPWGEKEGTGSVLTARVPAPGDGPIAPYVESTIRPIVQAWAPDGALYTAYTRMPDLADLRAGITRSHDPNATASEEAIVKNVGWPLAYLSESRREALFFYAAGVVMRVQWFPKRYTEQSVPVPAEAAIKTVVAALRDRTAVSEEAHTGIDHFLGVPYVGVFGLPGANVHDDLVPTYDVPDVIPWYATLSAEYAEKPVWYVGSSWGGGGMVDALTGKLIRFTRLRVGHGTGGPPSPFAPPAP
ncbi:hypothetical protein D3C72_470770 [compost metagenome]